MRGRRARLLVAFVLGVSEAMRTGRPWTEKHWCESIEEPEWPLAYQKYKEQSVESKGRVNSNVQDMRHKCVTYGGESKCHICEDIEDNTIHYQLQGVAWEEMAHNIPTVTDSPFAVSWTAFFIVVGPCHRWHLLYMQDKRADGLLALTPLLSLSTLCYLRYACPGWWLPPF